MKNKYLNGNLAIVFLALLTVLRFYISWREGESMSDPIICFVVLALIVICRTLATKLENKQGRAKLRKFFGNMTVILGIAVIGFLITGICSRPYSYSEEVKGYNEVVSSFDEMPTMAEIEKSVGAEYYTYNKKNESNSATAIIQYDAEGYWKKLLDLHKYGEGNVTVMVGSKNPEFDGYKFIAVDSVGSVKFEHLILIGINGSERKIAYICYNNLSYNDPLTKDVPGGGTMSRSDITLKSFIEHRCGWIRHNRVKEKSLSEKN